MSLGKKPVPYPVHAVRKFTDRRVPYEMCGACDNFVVAAALAPPALAYAHLDDAMKLHDHAPVPSGVLDTLTGWENELLGV